MKSLAVVKPRKHFKNPLHHFAVSAGKPIRVDDDEGDYVDLYDYLLHDIAATHLIIVEGDSMIDADIHEGDTVIVDTSLEPYNGDIVVARVNDEYVIKRFRKYSGRLWLVPENANYEAMELKAEHECKVWGVVTSVIHKFR